MKDINEIIEYLKSDNWEYYPFGTVRYKVLSNYEIDILLKYLESKGE